MPQRCMGNVGMRDRGASGRWSNDDGSVLELEVHHDGRLSGTLRLAGDGVVYRPHQVTGTYQVRPDGKHGIVGSVPGWPAPATVTVWCGELDPETGELSTRWLVAAEPGVSPGWNDDLGGEMFHRQGRRRSSRRIARGIA